MEMHVLYHTNNFRNFEFWKKFESKSDSKETEIKIELKWHNDNNVIPLRSVKGVELVLHFQTNCTETYFYW